MERLPKGTMMIPDIELDECISMVTAWFDDAVKMQKVTDDFEYVLIAHRYKEIIRHLKAYRELKNKINEEQINEL